jgi:exodeoxyribonuclease VII small subunit
MTKKELSYKEAYARLQEIQDLIEGDRLEVDELEIVLKEASKLLKTCKAKLYRVEEVAKIIMQEQQ